MHYAFMMSFEHEQITATHDGDTSRLNIPVRFKRVLLNDNQQQGHYPVVLELHGKLARVNTPSDWGAALLPLEEMPISLTSPTSEYFANLSFVFSRLYLQHIEEQRAVQAGQNIQLSFRMWGIAAIMKRSTPGTRVTGQQAVPHPLVDEVVSFENVRTDFNNPPSLRIARSDWIDTLLPGLGYRRSVLIELPLIRPILISETYPMAVEALEKARSAFNHEDYRGTLKYGREVLEHLGNSSSDKSISTFCKEYLEPVVGETKSQAIDASLNILRRMTSASSHANTFSADRNIAAYVIETLALNLRYISSVLG